MLSTKVIKTYTPREAAKELTLLSRRKCGLEQYYSILRRMEIIDIGNNLLPPFDNNDLFWTNHQVIRSPHSGKVKKIHLQIICNYQGILWLAEQLNS